MDGEDTHRVVTLDEVSDNEDLMIKAKSKNQGLFKAKNQVQEEGEAAKAIEYAQSYVMPLDD
jgi:hypothetical protein